MKRLSVVLCRISQCWSQFQLQRLNAAAADDDNDDDDDDDGDVVFR